MPRVRAEHLYVVFTAAIISALLAGTLVWLWANARTATLAERARLSAESLVKAEAELIVLRARASELEAERAALREAQGRLLESFTSSIIIPCRRRGLRMPSPAAHGMLSAAGS